MTGTTLGVPPATRVLFAEDFSTELAPYTFWAGGASASVAGGKLVPGVTGVDYAFYRTGLAVVDLKAILRYDAVPDATAPASEAGIVFRFLDTSNYLWLHLSGTTGASSLDLFKSDSGGSASLTSGSTGALATQPYWLVAYAAGNFLRGEFWNTDPRAGGTPSVALTHTLSGANATKFGEGVAGSVGVRTLPTNTSERWDDFVVVDLAYAKGA